MPHFVQQNAAAITGQAAAEVHVHAQMIGGSFGHRLEDDAVRHATRIAMARGRGRVTAGRVEAYDIGIAMPSVLASQIGRQGIPAPGPDLQIVAGALDQPLAVPHYRVTEYRAPELVPVSSWRYVGAVTNGFFHDCLLDDLIHAARADPLTERLRLCNQDLSRRVLEAVGEMS